MGLRVKVCGTTTLADARLAAEVGADMLGFIFYERSPRAITVDAAARVVAALRDELGEAAPQMVGIFVDEPLERVRAVRAQVGLDLAQLHGSEPPIEVEALRPWGFKAIRPRNRGDAEAMVATYARSLPHNPVAPDFLLDAYDPWTPGGTGQRADASVAKVIGRRFRLMLAGGLSPDNVAEAVRAVRPWGVDVVSGVEAAKGVKDPARLRAFVEAARAAERDLTGFPNLSGLEPNEER